uniref:phosphotransferase n=1 Tax=Ningiella ruwaisensis TaxID=2364274 RepID=UPI0010A01220|nr:phosphotransferase [Ningiella ruwaisensis]
MQNHQLLMYCVQHLSPGGQIKLENLHAGALNASYCLTIDNRRYLVKQFMGTRHLPIKPKHSFALQLELAKYGLAPRPLHLSSDQKVYIEEWVSHKVHGLSKPASENDIDLLAQSLLRIHKQPLLHDTVSLSKDSEIVGLPIRLLPKIDLPGHWGIYLKSIKDPQRKWKAKAKEYTNTYQQYCLRLSDDFTLCHNDLSADHIASSKGLFFDWEYAGLGCRFFDLLACGLANGFSQEEMDALVLRYVELCDYHREEVFQRVKLLQPLVIFTYQLWWQAHQAICSKREQSPQKA